MLITKYLCNMGQNMFSALNLLGSGDTEMNVSNEIVLYTIVYMGK